MGIKPYLVSTSVVGVMAQRLVRKICNNCKEDYEASKYEKEILGQDVDKPTYSIEEKVVDTAMRLDTLEELVFMRLWKLQESIEKL